MCPGVEELEVLSGRFSSTDFDQAWKISENRVLMGGGGGHYQYQQILMAQMW